MAVGCMRLQSTGPFETLSTAANGSPAVWIIEEIPRDMDRLNFKGLGMGLGTLSRLSAAQTRSISAENPTGEPGRGGMTTEGTGAVPARELGQGWKVSPSIEIAGGETVTLADIAGPGAVQHIWLTVHPRYWRSLVWRMWWDDEETPSIETPLGDFFCNGWGERCNVSSLPVAVNPAGGFNCYWEMPFRRRARISIENLSPDPVPALYYQITYTLTDVPEDCAYLRAQWRRSNPLPYQEVHTLLDGIRGQGQYVGTYLAWGSTIPVGGAKGRSSSISTLMTSGRRFAARGRRTTSAARGTSSIRLGSMEPTPPRFSGCR